MKVLNNMQVNPVLKAYQKQIEKTEKTGPAAMARDKIEISDQARDFQTAMKAFKELPEVREEKLDEIRSQMEKGEYKPSSEAVVGKLMDMLKSK